MLQWLVGGGSDLLDCPKAARGQIKEEDLEEIVSPINIPLGLAVGGGDGVSQMRARKSQQPKIQGVTGSLPDFPSPPMATLENADLPNASPEKPRIKTRSFNTIKY